MGSSCSSQSGGADEIRKSKAIDKQLEKERERNATNQKLLLLGTGECGKSTILKQIQILHNNGFLKEDIIEKKSLINSNIILGMHKLIEGVGNMGMIFDAHDEERSKVIIGLVEGSKEQESFTPDVEAALKTLWKCPVVRQVYDRRSEIQVADSVEYFFDNLDRISRSDYMPNNDDLLHLRVPTTGVVQMQFPIKGSQFKFVDVGGQRSERKKWLHQFDDVSAVIFLSAISEYDQMLAEDRNVNRMEESIQLYRQISKSAFFAKSTMILFLNKRDLFLQKIKKKNISAFFRSYKGSNNYDESIAFIRSYFITVSETKTYGKNLYIHETCATDTDQVALIIDSVIDAIITRNLQGTGIEM